MMSRFFRDENANAVLEFALFVPVMIGIILVSADLYNINRMRGVMEQTAHNLSSILSNQQEWNIKSFDYLVEQVVDVKSLGDYSLVVSKVNLDRTMDWLPIYRGELDAACPSKSEGNRYLDDMPEEDEDVDNISLVVVQLCRYTDDLIVNSGLLGNKLMESVAVNRLMFHSIVLDKPLSEEVGVGYE